MKKAIVIVLCIILGGALLIGVFADFGSNVKNAKVYDVPSELYTKDDIDSAIEQIKREFALGWRGCELLEIYYAGDDVSAEYQDWAERYNADEVIVLLSSFETDSPAENSGLNSDFTYKNWNWILVRSSGGNWKHVDHGY